MSHEVDLFQDPHNLEVFEEEQRAKTIKRVRHAEDVALSEAVKVALEALKAIASDESGDTEERIDAASRILGYASEFVPAINFGVTTNGDEGDGEVADNESE